MPRLPLRVVRVPCWVSSLPRLVPSVVTTRGRVARLVVRWVLSARIVVRVVVEVRRVVAIRVLRVACRLVRVPCRVLSLPPWW